MHLLFVCTGNTCRSPLAEVILRKNALDRGMTDVEVRSAGVAPHPDSPASDGSLLVALEQGLDLSEHRAQKLSTKLVAWADIILTMGQPHLAEVIDMGGAGKSYLLTDYASGSDRAVADPFGGDLETYRATFSELSEEIGNVLDRVVSERHRRSV